MRILTYANKEVNKMKIGIGALITAIMALVGWIVKRLRRN
jgi:hypothetical protein